MDEVRTAVASVLALALCGGCDHPLPELGSGRAVQVEAQSASGHVVDSILPPEESLRRFRAGLRGVARLDGPRSRAELLQQFDAALETRDRGRLEALAVTKAEYAYLVYPELEVSRPPYRQPPEIAWLVMSASSSGSLTKLLSRADRFQTVSCECAAPPELEGALRVWHGCTVRLRDAGASRSLRLFGAIVERSGRFKFASYANDL